MGKALYIAEKPSVAQEFSKALKINARKQDGYMESDHAIVTWCVGHLVTMSYPEVYDPAYKKWAFATLPFLPDTFLYEVIPGVKKQFTIVKGLLNRKDVETIYVCTDSGREGEYIYRLVDQMAGTPVSKERRRVWIDSQTEEEILRGIKEAKPLSTYDNLSSAAYLRAKEDYLMGINFSRVLSLRYGQTVNQYLKSDKWTSISVGRVMTCVLGMVVRREQEIRDFVKTPFYRVVGNFVTEKQRKLDGNPETAPCLEAEWKAVRGSQYFESSLLYKENGFKKRKDAEILVSKLKEPEEYPLEAVVEKIERKKENKQPPLLFNLAELQNVCSKMFKISPDETLKMVQELYEKKLVTYPRTDARVLSTAVSKEIVKNITGLKNYSLARNLAESVLASGSYQNIARTKYVNDKQITDHYAIIPTGQGFSALHGLTSTAGKIYETIVRRFLAIFYPPAVYQKTGIVIKRKEERFFANTKVLVSEGYFVAMKYSFFSKKETDDTGKSGNAPDTVKTGETWNPSVGKEGRKEAEKLQNRNGAKGEEDNTAADRGLSEEKQNERLAEMITGLKKGGKLLLTALTIKEGETSPPKRYNSGSMILAMENAGQLIEDEELRAQIKGSGIGTSATRAEILNKLIHIEYLNLNKKTQIITPALKGEMIYYVVLFSIRSLLNPELTASWEKGLTQVAEGSISEAEYMKKLTDFVSRNTNAVKNANYQAALLQWFDRAAGYYK